MVDKCFLLSEECVAREIRLHVPPGKNGKTQMDPADERKTEIANLQILVEQPIQWLKCFRILANEMGINQLQCADDVLKVCAALSNLRKPTLKRLSF